MGKNFRETLNQQLQNPKFKTEWDALEPEFQIIKAMIDGRKEKNITQKELADLTGMTQADISRIETGNSNPSIQTLQRLAAGLGMRVKLEFVPLSSNK
ncbi:helix-turn-helix domain-containing protein [Butyribacter intestini]|uniref:helix-turn-helix domain-containing protein n=1 Tax=Butyribacter intestini TaxID=1703332 RepID=UPI003AB8329D